MAYDTNRTFEGAGLWVLQNFVKNGLATTLNSRKSPTTHIASVVALVTTIKPTTQKKFLCSYPEVVNYVLKKFANDKAIAEIDCTILRFSQPTSMTPMQYADDLYAKSSKVADAYEELTLNNIFIEEVDSSICHSLREY